MCGRFPLSPSTTTLYMSGECTVFTCPAYSSWSSIGIKTLSPSTRESLSSTHCTGAGVEDLSDTLLLRGGRSSSSLKLLSWLGSKSSSAAMLSISRLTAPLEGSLALVLAFGWLLRAGLRLRDTGLSVIGLHRVDGLTGRGESFSFFFFHHIFPLSAGRSGFRSGGGLRGERWG